MLPLSTYKMPFVDQLPSKLVHSCLLNPTESRRNSFWYSIVQPFEADKIISRRTGKKTIALLFPHTISSVYLFLFSHSFSILTLIVKSFFTFNDLSTHSSRHLSFRLQSTVHFHLSICLSGDTPYHQSMSSNDASTYLPGEATDSLPADAKPIESEPTKRSFLPWKKNASASKKDHDQVQARKVSFFQLFRYTDGKEKVYVVIAVIAAAIHGALLPLFTIFFGNVIDAFSGANDSETADKLAQQSKWFLVLGAIAFVTSLIQIRFQIIVSQRLCARLRTKYFESLMSQDFTWYNANDGGELTTRVANDVNVIQAGVGDKVAAAVQFLMTAIVGIVIAFVFNPLLTLVVFTIAPLLMIGGAVFAKLATENTGDGLGAYGLAGGIASEAIGLIRIVTTYNGQQSEIKRYSKELDKAYIANVKKHLLSGVFLGFTMFVIFCSYAIAFTFGAYQVRQDNGITAGKIVTAFFAVIIACFSLGQGMFSIPPSGSTYHITFIVRIVSVYVSFLFFFLF